MGVTLSPDSIPKLRRAIQDGENYRMSRGRERLPTGPQDGPFWAFLTGAGFESPVNQNASPGDARMVYSFVRITPCADREADLWLNNSQAYRFVEEAAAHIRQAIEINARPCPANEIVQMNFVGFTEETEDVEGQPVKVRRPRFAFSHTPRIVETHLPIHDHRDNVTGGGFAFAVYHPGTGLPQQPWAL